jgi:hypothetical protein
LTAGLATGLTATGRLAAAVGQARRTVTTRAVAKTTLLAASLVTTA